MTRPLGFIAALAIILTGSSLAPVLAHEMGGEAGGAAGWHGKGGRFKEALGLTDEQITKMQAIRDSRDKAVKPLRRKQRDLVLKLKDRLEDKASDADIKPILAELRANREAIKAQTKQFQDQENATLTPTQQARMLLMKMHRRGGWSHHQGNRMGRDEGPRGGQDGDPKREEEHG